MGLVENGNCDTRATIASVSGYQNTNGGWLALVDQATWYQGMVNVSNIFSLWWMSADCYRKGHWL